MALASRVAALLAGSDQRAIPLDLAGALLSVGETTPEAGYQSVVYEYKTQ